MDDRQESGRITYDEWLKIVDEVSADNTNPLCDACGCRTRTRGGYWRCPECGRWTVKIRRRDPVEIDRTGIRCPECGAENPTSNGVDWRCRNCGRRWRKMARNALSAR